MLLRRITAEPRQKASLADAAQDSVARGVCGFRSPSEPSQALSWLPMAAAPLGNVPAAGPSAVQANHMSLVAPAISKLLSADMCRVGTSLPGL